MVDSSNIIGGPISTLLRAQAAGAPTVTALTQTQPAQAIINQQSSGARPAAQPILKSVGTSKADTDLPRGSILDILV